MRHLTIAEYGNFVGIQSDRLVVYKDNAIILETPLSRLRSIMIAKEGVSFSSNLLVACASRGIRLFITDWRGHASVVLSGQHRHAIANLRRMQFQFIESVKSRQLSAGVIYGKVRNQRAVLLYFSKYHKALKEPLSPVIASLDELSRRLKETNWESREQWREEIMGIEGASAALYWKFLSLHGLLNYQFDGRVGRGAPDVANQLLNYGYALLSSYVWAALDNAGFELYAGFLHQERAGKPSLVLDVMEEYRAWIVDRQVIAMRPQYEHESKLNSQLKKSLSRSIQEVMSTRYPYRGKRLKLETILQRQAYRLASCIVEGERYQPYRFKW